MKISRRRFLKTAFLGVGGLALTDGLAIERRWLSFDTIQISLPGLGKNFDGFRIAHLSDFHYPNWISDGHIARALQMAADFDPDIIVLTGDFVHSPHVARDLTVMPFAHLYKSVKARYGVFAVLGNHDYWLNSSAVRAELSKTPIQVLMDEATIVTRGGDRLAIVGVDDYWEGGLDFEKAFTQIPIDVPRILLQHNPDLAEELPEQYRVDLQLSGHMHGGQIKIPFGPALILPSKYGNKYREGLVHGPRYPVYITRGIGVSSIPLRIFCRPQVSGLILRSA